MGKGLKILGLVIIGGGIYVVSKGLSLFDFADQLVCTPKIDGGLKRISFKNGNLNIPLAIVFENKTDKEVTIGLSNIIIKYNGNEVGSLQPNSRTVKIERYKANTLAGLTVSVPLTNLVKYAGQAISTLITTQNFSKIVSCLSADIRFILNNSIICRFTQKFGEATHFDPSGNVKGLGLVASRPRNLKPFKDYEMYIPPKSELYNRNMIVFPNGGVDDTVALMKKVAKEFAPDTKILAQKLRRNTLDATLQSIFDFVYNYIKYEQDNITTEQVRRPLRTLWDRKGDCDCFATLIGSILTNLGIPYKFRVAAYHGRENFQHVYVIVPTGAGYKVCDPVLDKCFSEKPPSKTMDF